MSLFTKKEGKKGDIQFRAAQAAVHNGSMYEPCIYKMFFSHCVCCCAAELGLHGLVIQSKSRGDDDHPIGGGGGRERKGSGADASYTPLQLCKYL